MSDTCICCGRDIPEGRQVCMQCETMPTSFAPDGFMEDGTPIYFKTGSKPEPGSLQLLIYDLLNRRKRE